MAGRYALLLVVFIRDLLGLVVKFSFFGQQKPIGTLSQTQESSQAREERCLVETIKRLGTYASRKNQQMMVVMDSTDAHNRERAVQTLGRTIYSTTNKDVKSIIEIPIQADSKLYGTIQLADWTCALLSRLGHYQFTSSNDFSWSVDMALKVWGPKIFTDNSVIWTNDRTVIEKCFPPGLLEAKPFIRKMAERQIQNHRKEARNKTAIQCCIDGSPGLKEKLENIRNSAG